MLGKKYEITSIGNGTIGSGFFDPSGSTTYHIKKVREILLDVNTQENACQQAAIYLFSQEFHLMFNYFAGKRAPLSKEHDGSQHRENKYKLNKTEGEVN
jgi:hypothetical protein